MSDVQLRSAHEEEEMAIDVLCTKITQTLRPSACPSHSRIDLGLCLQVSCTNKQTRSNQKLLAQCKHFDIDSLLQGVRVDGRALPIANNHFCTYARYAVNDNIQPAGSRRIDLSARWPRDGNRLLVIRQGCSQINEAGIGVHGVRNKAKVHQCNYDKVKN